MLPSIRRLDEARRYLWTTGWSELRMKKSQMASQGVHAP
jgi:hypothetical protein